MQIVVQSLRDHDLTAQLVPGEKGRVGEGEARKYRLSLRPRPWLWTSTIAAAFPRIAGLKTSRG